jgi:hypothetical protein
VSAGIYILPVAGLLLEVCLALRLLFNGLWRRYPWFCAYVVFSLAANLAMFVTAGFFQASYAHVYRTMEALSNGLRFPVIWEVYRDTFPRGSAVRRILSSGLADFVTGALILLLGSLWSYETYLSFHSLYPALDRGFGFTQSVLLLAILSAARYYRIQLGRNIWGISIALGAYASVATVNNAVIDLIHSYLPYWRLLSPLSFVAMLAVWTWAAWGDAPNPQIAVEVLPSLEAEAVRWGRDWDETRAAVRRVGNP